METEELAMRLRKMQGDLAEAKCKQNIKIKFTFYFSEICKKKRNKNYFGKLKKKIYAGMRKN